MLRTLKGRTALAAAVLAAGGIALVTTLHSRLSEHTVLASTVAQHESYTHRVAMDVEKQLRHARAALSEFASNIEREHLEHPASLHHFLSVAVGLQERFESVQVYSRTGELMASRPSGAGPSVAGEEWFRKSVAGNGTPVIRDPFVSPLSGESTAVITYPVHDEAGQLRAILTGAVALKQDELWVGEGGRDTTDAPGIILLTANRTVALHPDRTYIARPLADLGEAAAVIEQGLRDPSKSLIGVNHRGVQSLYSFRTVPAAGWSLVGVVANETASASLARLSNKMLLAGGALAALLFPAMWLLVSRMLRPLDRLREEMKRLRERSGVEEPRVRTVGASREISALAEEFVDLARAWRSAESALQREKERAEVTLDSIAEGVIATDRDGVIVAMNGAAESITGWPADKAVGRRFAEVFRLEDERTGAVLTDLSAAAMQLGDVTFVPGAQLRGYGGALVPVHNSAAPIRNAVGEIDGAVIVFRDVASEREAAQQLEWRATHDLMTGLVNRHAYEQALERLCESIRPGEHHALLVLDLDQFKLVNDTCGHAAGDALLKELADLFVARCRKADMVARLGGDEFAVLMYRCSGVKAARVAEDLLQAVMEHRFEWDGRTFAVGASIGVVEVNAAFCDPVEVVKAADMAAYMAKRSGGTRICQHSGSDEQLHAMRNEMAAVSTIREAIEAGRLRLYAQTIKSLRETPPGGHHFEILVRMVDEQGAVLTPSAFLPAAERYGLMRQIDRWVIANAARTLAERFGPDRWHELDTASINLSAITLKDAEIGAYIVEQLQGQRVPLECICFEITETAAIENLAKVRELMHALRQQGLRFALDDFGVGMTSLSQLRDLPIDVLKIDGSFICGIDQDAVNGPLVDAIQSIARKFSMSTVAERVETMAELRHLRAIGIDFAQGHLVAHPVPLQVLIGRSGPRHLTRVA